MENETAPNALKVVFEFNLILKGNMKVYLYNNLCCFVVDFKCGRLYKYSADPSKVFTRSIFVMSLFGNNLEHVYSVVQQANHVHNLKLL